VKNKSEAVRAAVQDRYAKIAEGTASECCRPRGCCSERDVALDIGYGEGDLGAVPESANLGLGCGNPTALASLQPGEVVLDLGAGGGLDCFLASQAVGPTGRVIGVDMTPEMVALARKNAENGGYGNVEFHLGRIEELPVEDSSVDVILSNCVINLSPEPERVFSEAFRVLKPGGRLMISDLISDLPVPQMVQESLTAWVQCLPVKRDVYLSRIEEVGFDRIEVADERAYQTEHLASTDSSLGRIIAAAGPLRPVIDRFARGIKSARIAAYKPAPAA